MPKKNDQTTLLQLREQISKLEAQAEKLKASERADVIARIKKAIPVYDITAKDLGLSTKGKRGSKAKATKAAKPGKRTSKKSVSTVKYKNETGQTWGGRGPRPAWLRKAIEGGATLESFAVKD